MAIDEWRRQLKNKEGIAGMYRQFFPNSTGPWDKIMEEYIAQLGWIGFAVKEGTSNVTSKDIEEAVKTSRKKKKSDNK